MNTSITLRKLAMITAGLALTATASLGHAQQKSMEQLLEQSLQEHTTVKEESQKNRSGEQGKATETADESLRPQDAAPDDIDISNLYDDEGDSRI